MRTRWSGTLRNSRQRKVLAGQLVAAGGLLLGVATLAPAGSLVNKDQAKSEQGAAARVTTGTDTATTAKTSVDPADRGKVDELWKRANDYIDKDDYAGALPLLLQGGRLGDARAQSTLGIVYKNGLGGVKADDRQAVAWFELAAAQRHRAAEFALSGMYENGESGLPKDKSKALQLLQDSADQGFDRAQLALGIAYELGDGVSQDRRKAIILLQKAGRQKFEKLGIDLAEVLTAPETPAHFANAGALLLYLQELRRDEMAKIPPGKLHGAASQSETMARVNAAPEFSQWLTQRSGTPVAEPAH